MSQQSEDRREASAAPSATAESNSIADTKKLTTSLCDIVRGMVQEHLNWVQGFHSWTQQMLMNMQQIPPQAHADFANRQRWVCEYLAQFDEIAAILKRNGFGDLAALLDEYKDGFDRVAATQQETSMAMMQEDAETRRGIMNIQNQIAADDMKAAAERHKIQKTTYAAVNTMTAEGISAQQESFDDMNKAVNRGLFGP